MRYKIRSGIEIKTENAAKPATQPSQYLLTTLANLPKVESAFDYGCGKLRYQSALASRSDTLAVIDSEIQLSRTQVLLGRQTSVRELFKRANNIDVYNDQEFDKLTAKFDRGACINVLSVIPSYSRRKKVLQSIQRKLKPGGACLFVTQYRNSDFTRMSQLPNAKPWLDGFIVDSLRGYSFYGMIGPSRLEASLRRAGFSILGTKLNEGSAYVWAGTS